MSDRMTFDGVTYYRLDDDAGIYADVPYAIRVQVDVPLTEEQANTLAALVGYAYAKTGGERGNGFTQDSPNSIMYWCDTTKGRAYQRLDQFFGDARIYIVEGSPQRKTKNMTRLVEGLGDVGNISFWADSVCGNVSEPSTAPTVDPPKPAPAKELAQGVYTVDESFFRVGRNESMSQFRAGKWRPLTRADEKQDAEYAVKSRGRRTSVSEAVTIGRASGTCLACGRALKDPSSLARGVGAECLKKFG
jgi:hypothetical protein